MLRRTFIPSYLVWWKASKLENAVLPKIIPGVNGICHSVQADHEDPDYSSQRSSQRELLGSATLTCLVCSDPSRL